MTQRPPARAGRRLGCLLVLFLALVSALAIGAEIVRRSDLPRGIVEGLLADRLAADVSIEALRTSWSGETAIRGISVRDPMSPDPMLVAVRVQVVHTGLLALPFRGLEITSIVVDGAAVDLRQAADGVWNVEELFRNLPEGGGGGPLPDVRIDDATLRIAPHAMAAHVIEPVSISGGARGGGPWAFEVTIAGGAATVEGTVSKGGRHEIALASERPLDIVGPWADGLPHVERVGLRWVGGAGRGRIAGRLELESIAVEGVTARGSASIGAEGGAAWIRPGVLRVEHPDAGEVVLSGGRIDVGAARIAAEQVIVTARGTSATVTASWDRVADLAQVGARWLGTHAGDADAVEHFGDLSVEARLGMTGPISVSMTSNLTVHSGSRALRGTVRASAAGAAWTTLDGSIAVTTGAFEDERGVIPLDGLAASARLEWPALRLLGVTVPPAASTEIRGALDFDARTWSLAGAVERLLVARLGPEAIDVRFAASGDVDRAAISSLDVTRGQLHVTGDASLERARTPALTAHLRADWTLPVPAPDVATVEGPPPPFRGLHLVLDASGDAVTSFAWSGTLTVDHLTAAHATIERLEVPANGRLDGRTLSFLTGQSRVLDGTWIATGQCALDTGRVAVDLVGSDLPLATLAKAIDLDQAITGVAGATLHAELPIAAPRRFELTGTWTVRDLASRYISASSGSGKLESINGVLHLRTLELENGEGRLAGSASYDVRTGKDAGFAVEATRWAVDVVDGLRVVVDGSGSGRLDLVARTGAGSGAFSATAIREGEEIASAAVTGSITNDRIVLEKLDARGLGGSLAGSGSVTIGAWWDARGDFTVADVDLAGLEAFAPQAAGLTGHLAGSVAIVPANGARALEPLRLDVTLAAPEGRYRDGVDLRSLSAEIYLGPSRWLLHKGRVEVAGGSIDLWGRLSRHPVDRTAQVIATARGLDLTQISLGLAPDQPPVVGRLGGEIRAGGSIDEPGRTFGTARLAIDQADLGAMPLVSTLYDLLRLGSGGDSASGSGSIEFLLEGSRIEIPQARYFHRGTFIAGSATVEDIRRGLDSPIEGVAVGSLRPLFDVRIAFLEDLDRIAQALASGTSAVRISGTLSDREITTVPLAEVQGSIGRMFRSLK